MIVKKLLVHQSLIIQAPFRYTDVRFFFLIAGYGAGKTSSLNDALIKGVMELSGKKDREGKLPKIMLCGITLTFLKKTFSGAFVQILKNTKSKFEYDKAHNIITVAGVEIYLTPIIEPDEIFGYDVAAVFVDELDELPTYKAIAVVKSLNDRARQLIEGCRQPYLCFATTSQGLKGTYQVVENFKRIGMNHLIIRGRTRDNTFLPKEYVETMYKIYNEKERRCLLEGEFLSIEAGKVYPDYNPAVNKSRINFAHKVRATDVVYIGQDFNCIEGNTLIYTALGNVPIKDIQVGDLVLTRHGYKKVLTTACKGIKIVTNTNGVYGTDDHVAITPEGDMSLCKIREQKGNFYFLPDAYTQEHTYLHAEQESARYLKQLYSTEWFINENLSKVTIFVLKEIELCIEQYTKCTTARYLKTITSTIQTALTIIGQMLCKHFQTKNTHDCTGKKSFIKTCENQNGKTEKKQRLHTTEANAERKCTAKRQKRIGQQEYTKLRAFVLTAVNLLKLRYELRNVAKRAKALYEELQKEKRTTEARKDVNLRNMKKLIEFASFAENTSKELLQQSIAKHTSIIGYDQTKNDSHIAEVYDIEVEDAHEFYANGILVHNCGCSKAAACIVVGNQIVVVKEYNFPDVRRAPEVFRYDFPESQIVWIPDATSNQLMGNFKKECKAFNIRVAYRTKNPLVRDRTFLINKLFYSNRLLVGDGCEELDNALIIRQNDPKTGVPMKGQGESAPDHVCFEANTKIATAEGYKNISEIRVGDMILTRSGYKKCTASTCTGIRQTYIYEIAGNKIECTEDHPIWTSEHGMRPVKDLAPSNTCCILTAWQQKSKSYSTASSIDGIQKLNKLQKAGFALKNVSQKHVDAPELTTKLVPVSGVVVHSKSINTAKQAVVVTAVPRTTGGVKEVYNITVEGEHEYFANNILVSNCDALEYATYYIVSWVRAFKDIYGATVHRLSKKRIDAGMSNVADETYTTDENSGIPEVTIDDLAEE